jgi:L-malate glycosyltransferase
MRICLMSLSYPPRDTEGISRQRQTLAAELMRLGHEVHVVTLGAFSHVLEENGVYVHKAAVNWSSTFSDLYPGMNQMLARSQALYEGLQRALEKTSCDIVDIPLWSAQGFVTQQYYTGATIIWLQTTLPQILKIHARSPGEEEKIKLYLERMSLERASGLLADSQSVLDSVQQDYQIELHAPSGVAYLGIEALRNPPERPRRKQVEALVVGRLEQRKGTSLLFEILPALLGKHPHLTVRFVGRDNSQSDGWQALHGSTYPEYFRRHYSHLAARVVFEGYVGEERLQDCYSQADLFLAPTRYESFGLTYLEAMRTALPVVTFASGAATEIFARGTADGAMVVPAEDAHEFASAVSTLIEDPRARWDLGNAGLQRFQSTFTAAAMAKSTVRFYEETLVQYSTSQPVSRKIYQVMEAMDVGDAVSKIVLKNADLLAELDQPSEILSRYAHEEVRSRTTSRSRVLTDQDCGLIFHFWGRTNSSWMLRLVRGRKAIYYHNITPPHFFSRGSAAYRQTSQGYAQLGRILAHVDLLIGDSQYNIESLAPYLTRPLPALPIYPVFDPTEITGHPYDEALVDRLRAACQINILFVGRVARNKRQDRLMQVFEYYYRNINRHAHLWLVGNENSDPAYRVELERLRGSFLSGSHIHFCGKVRDEATYAYYRAADIFLSASEHEGFGMPIAEAMALDIPVIAFAAAAVPETMGRSGILLREWDPPRIAELMHLLTRNESLRQTVVEEQRLNLGRFSSNKARACVKAAVHYLQSGEMSSQMTIQEPQGNRDPGSLMRNEKG